MKIQACLNKICFDLKSTIRIYIYLAFFWFLLGCLLTIWQETLLFSPDSHLGLTYARLYPLSSFILLFGAFASFIFALTYYVLDKKLTIDRSMALLAFVGMKLHQSALFLGASLLLLGYNKGRILGELPWFLDPLLFLAFAIIPLILLLSMRRSPKKQGEAPLLLDPVLGLLLIAGMGSAWSWLLGNFQLPFDFLHSVPLLSGLEDRAVEALYHSGLFSFLITAFLLALLYYFVPFYYQTKLYSSSIHHFVIASLLALTPLAAASKLLYTAAPDWLESMGIFCSIALAFAVMAGLLNAMYTISRSEKSYHSDALGIMLRAGLFFFLLHTLLKVFWAPRFMQSWSAYTTFMPDDAFFAIHFYALMLGAVMGLIALQKITSKALSPAALGFLAVCWITGIILLYLGKLTSSIAQYNVISALDSEGGLVYPDWEKVFFAGNLYPSSLQDAGLSITGRYLLSSSGMSYAAYILITLGLFALCLHMLFVSLFAKQGSYQEPDLSVKDTEQKEEA